MGYLTPYQIDKEAWTERLLESRDRILTGLGRLGAGLAAVFQRELAGTLEVVNSYYSNRMEGNPTRIGDIFSAKEGHFAKSTAERNYQLEHLAHIHTATKMRAALVVNPALSPTATDFLKMLHREFYGELPDTMRTAITTSGQTVPIIPGELRLARVSIGFHHAVSVEQLGACMDELANAYTFSGSTGGDKLVAMAAAHHRFLWIHPFADGNGRVVRLMSEAMAIQSGFSGHGLYSISRGLARQRKEYDAALAGADAPRYNDLDGRGNLSQKGLLQFCEFFLEVMADQIEFMGSLMDMPKLQSRFLRLLNVLRAEKKLSGSESVVLTYLLRLGEIRRGDIQSIAGVKPRQANKIGASLLKAGYVQSDSPKGLLRLKANQEVVRALFPEFYE